MNFKELFPSLLVNRDMHGSFPKNPSQPLIIDEDMIDGVNAGKYAGEKFLGYKGPILWTTGAVVKLFTEMKAEQKP